eukprot:COSAG02_NODE_9204_length_2289_cov_2.426027_1_plen_294_part_00
MAPVLKIFRGLNPRHADPSVAWIATVPHCRNCRRRAHVCCNSDFSFGGSGRGSYNSIRGVPRAHHRVCEPFDRSTHRSSRAPLNLHAAIAKSHRDFLLGLFRHPMLIDRPPTNSWGSSTDATGCSRRSADAVSTGTGGEEACDMQSVWGTVSVEEWCPHLDNCTAGSLLARTLWRVRRRIPSLLNLHPSPRVLRHPPPSLSLALALTLPFACPRRQVSPAALFFAHAGYRSTTMQPVLPCASMPVGHIAATGHACPRRRVAVGTYLQLGTCTSTVRLPGIHTRTVRTSSTTGM